MMKPSLNIEAWLRATHEERREFVRSYDTQKSPAESTGHQPGKKDLDDARYTRLFEL
jgi:hypothetical protein